jgi:hypothetical protein
MLDSLRGEVLSPLVGLLIMAILAISVVGIIQWRKIRQAEMETALKQQMLERGMSANEIAQVMSASPSKTSMNLPVV